MPLAQYSDQRGFMIAQRQHKIPVVDGFAVGEAGAGNAALDLIQSRAFDLALRDIHMPGLGAVETCQRIRTFASQIGI